MERAEIARLVEAITDDLNDADTAVSRGDYLGALRRFEAAQYLSGDLVDEMRRRIATPTTDRSESDGE